MKSRRKPDAPVDQLAICLNNALGRQILPALKRCEHCGKAQANHAEAKHDFKLDEKFPKWRGWHEARRGLGSNLYALGVSEKVIQQILRHANVSTTATYYIKTVPAQVTDAMEKLQGALPESLSASEAIEEMQGQKPVSLSGNEVATQELNAAAFSAVNERVCLRWSGGPGQSRTADQRFRIPLLYPSELRGHLS